MACVHCTKRHNRASRPAEQRANANVAGPRVSHLSFQTNTSSNVVSIKVLSFSFQQPTVGLGMSAQLLIPTANGWSRND